MRPRGIVLLAMIYFLIASLMALGAIAVLLGVRLPVQMQVSVPGTVVADPQEDVGRGLHLHWVAAFILVFFGAVFSGTGWGLLRLRSWARWLAVLISSLSFFSLIPGAPFSLFVGAASVPTAVWAPLLVFHGGILVYLFLPSVADAFVRKP